MRDGDIPLIPPSRRAHIQFLEHARVDVSEGTVVYVKAQDGKFRDYNIPYVNTSLLLLGEGTSITRDAARMLADNGVLVGFTGGGGTPLASVIEPVVLPLFGADEYRPTEYMQAWAGMFFDDNRRQAAARRFLHKRMEFTADLWAKLPAATEYGLNYLDLEPLSRSFSADISAAANGVELMAAEARYAKKIYAYCARNVEIEFSRMPGEGADPANRLLDHANYLIYGLAAVVLQALGISPSFPVHHGKTRRGALVFDVADLVKDGIALPSAFAAAAGGYRDQTMRDSVIDAIHRLDVLTALFDFMKQQCEHA